MVAAVEPSPELPDVAAWWQSYKATGDLEARNRLVAHYHCIAEGIARQMAAKMPRSVERDDLAQYGVFGLIDAIDKFEPDRGFKFETYAMARIRGAIIDARRVEDWVPRSIRVKDSVVESAAARLRARLNRNPTRAELVEEVGDDYVEPAPQVRSLDSRIRVDAEEGLAVSEAIEDGSRVDGELLGSETVGEIVDDVAAAIEALPPLLRIVVDLVYLERCNTFDIACAFDCSTGRASMQRQKALAAIAAYDDGRVLWRLDSVAAGCGLDAAASVDHVTCGPPIVRSRHGRSLSDVPAHPERTAAGSSEQRHLAWDKAVELALALHPATACRDWRRALRADDGALVHLLKDTIVAARKRGPVFFESASTNGDSRSLRVSPPGIPEAGVSADAETVEAAS